jgi:transglutaminase-like putative cysteine protease
LQALDFEETKLLEGSRSLLHIRAKQKLGERTLKVEYWTTADGEVLKMRSPTFDQVTYVTTREQALDAADAGTFDVLQASLVPVEAPFESAHRQRRVRYEVRVTGSPAQGLFRASSQQNVKVIDEHTVELDVRAQAGGSSTSESGSAEAGSTESDGSSRALSGADDRPTKGDEAPGSLIQSDDARIVAMAAEAAAEMSDTVELARRLEAYVHDKIENKSFALGFASAAEVAENLEGDCTEHAVLLAALCRARAIPARVAIGLVHLPTASGFAFHMWTEVWTGDRWLSLDATAGRGGTGAGYLKMSHTNLSGSDGFSAMAPVVEVMGRLQIKVLDFE